ncbi:hypothetical protein Tco_0054445 [Tanacetum coccineum]
MVPFLFISNERMIRMIYNDEGGSHILHDEMGKLIPPIIAYGVNNSANITFVLRPAENVTHPDANMAFDLRQTEDVLPWPGGANIAFDLVPDLQCLLRTWCEYGIRLSIELATPLTYVLYSEIITWHEDNYNGIVIPL